ncbi:uncharacterized protein LOC144153829 [Haemaphysalis longicornis]
MSNALFGIFVSGVATACAAKRKGRTALSNGRPTGTAPANAEIPETEFRCSNQDYPGYFADVETDCQVYHNCLADGRNSSFLCVNGTIFNQRNFVCDWWYKFDCRKAPSFYHLNLQRSKKPGNTTKPSEGSVSVAPPQWTSTTPQVFPVTKHSRDKDARPKTSSALTSRPSKSPTKTTKAVSKTYLKAPVRTHEPLTFQPAPPVGATTNGKSKPTTSTTAAPTTRERSSSSRGRAQMRIFAKISQGQQQEEPRAPKSKPRPSEEREERVRDDFPAFNGDGDMHRGAGGGGNIQEWSNVGPVSGRKAVTRVQFHTFSATPPRFEPPLPEVPRELPVNSRTSMLDDDFYRQEDAEVDTGFRGGEVEDVEVPKEEELDRVSLPPVTEATINQTEPPQQTVRQVKSQPKIPSQTADGGWRGKKEAYPGLQDKKRLFYRFQPSEPFAGHKALSFFGRPRGRFMPNNDLSKLPHLVSVKLNKVEKKEHEYAIKPLLLSVKLDQSSEVFSRPATGAPPGLCFCPCH